MYAARIISIVVPPYLLDSVSAVYHARKKKKKEN
jgi:hypothetical protein